MLKVDSKAAVESRWQRLLCNQVSLFLMPYSTRCTSYPLLSSPWSLSSQRCIASVSMARSHPTGNRIPRDFSVNVAILKSPLKFLPLEKEISGVGGCSEAPHPWPPSRQ